jgi:2-dehydro-3-deoxy-L-rhamnonate dehydrogenase (NAD+)
MSVLTGQIALVTGAGSGIGEATSIALANAGATVAVTDIDKGAAIAVCASITDSGGQAFPFELDVTDDHAVSAVLSEIVRTFGGLDIAVNNAGVSGEMNVTGDLSVEGWRKVMSVNIDAVFYCMRHEIKAMKERGGGSIINLASVLGTVAWTGVPGYIASKHAVVGLTKAAALDHAADNIRVNAVAPAFIHTPFLKNVDDQTLSGIAKSHPIGRMGEPEEVAALVTFLASAESSFMTGGYYPVDGGYLAR